MEYSFDDWLDGKPEPTYLFFQNDGFNPVYLEIQEAKRNVFDWSFEGLLRLGKEDFRKKLEGLTDSKKKSYTESLLKDSEIHFCNFDIKQLIQKSHPQKYDGIDGKKYKEVKKLYDDFDRGQSKGFSHFKNDFFKGVVFYELTEFYKSHLEDELKPLVQNNDKPEKGEPLAVRYFILEKMFEEKQELKNLSGGQKNQIIAKILGTSERTVKGIKNGESKYFNNEHGERGKDLINKIKKGDIL